MQMYLNLFYFLFILLDILHNRLNILLNQIMALKYNFISVYSTFITQRSHYQILACFSTKDIFQTQFLLTLLRLKELLMQSILRQKMRDYLCIGYQKARIQLNNLHNYHSSMLYNLG